MRRRIVLLDVLHNHLDGVVCIADVQLEIEELHNMNLSKDTIKNELEYLSKCSNIEQLTSHQYHLS